MKSYLQYTGKWRIIVDVIKKGKKPGSRTMVPTSLPSMVKRFFEKDDLLDERAIKYYKQLEELNVHLHLDNDEKIVEETIEFPTQEAEEVEIGTSEETENSTEEVVEETIEETPEVVEETIEETPEVVEEIPTAEEVESVEEVVEEVTSEETPQPIEESDRAEMIAYLDATYDKDGLKNLAKELGVEFSSRIGIEKLIEKLIDEKYPQILEMMQ